MHRLNPGGGERTEQAAAVQQVIDAAFDDVTFAAVEVRRIGGELARLGQRVQGDPVRGSVGDFASVDSVDPVCGVGDFETAAARYRRTVKRSTPSSRAIRRLDQPCSNRAIIDCCRFTLS